MSPDQDQDAGVCTKTASSPPDRAQAVEWPFSFVLGV
jgi:hypothetical protein